MKVKVTADDFVTAFKEVEPTSTREFMSERPNVFFKDVGGLRKIKENLLSLMRLPLQGFPIFANSRLSPPRGVLFSGPSGTGKTLMAKALAGEMGMTLFLVDPPTLLSKWVGESEKGLREVFKRAKQASPCILFFDEIEAMAPARTAEDSGQVSQRIVSQLFRELDGLPSSLGIAVVAATNRIDLMEPALLRAGRFDSIIEFPLPEKEERVEILELYLLSLPFRSEVDIELLAGMSEGSTGAELEALCKKAVVLVLEEGLAKGGDARLFAPHDHDEAFRAGDRKERGLFGDPAPRNEALIPCLKEQVSINRRCSSRSRRRRCTRKSSPRSRT